MNFPARLLFLSIFCLLIAVNSFAQTPELINYQAVARNTQTGLELANTQIFVSCIVRSGGPNGTIVFQESHGGVSTDQFGLFSIQIGGGSAVTGSLGSVNWATGTYWLDTEVDAGNGLQSAGSLQLVAVPYALHARTADIVDDADANPTNELVEALTLSSTGTLTLAQNNGDSNLSVDLSDFNSNDNDPTNEFVTDFTFNEETRDLTIEQGSGPDFTTNIGGVDDADADPTNELVNAFTFNSAARTISLAQNDGSSFSINIGGVDDADADPSNELVDALDFAVDTRILELTQGDGTTLTTSIPFPDALWEFNEPIQTVFNNSNRVGIGLDDPEARLSIQPADNNEPGLEVLTSGGQPILEVKDDGVGIGAPNVSNSDIFMGGSVAHKTRIIEQNLPSTLNVNILPDDYVVVIDFVNNFAQVEIDLPDPADFPGRLLIFKRYGQTGGSASVIFNFLGAEINGGSTPGLSFGQFIAVNQITLLSTGASGWITL